MDYFNKIEQHNQEGPNNVIINYGLNMFRAYENELSVGLNKKFLDGASESVIQDGKFYPNWNYIDKVKHYLDSKKFCLIKAPEGRGKTYLSRIIAYDYYHNEEMKVYFLDLKYYNNIIVKSIEDKLIDWHKNDLNNYLIVIENVHVYEKLDELMELIKGWVGLKENRFHFLLNARPANVDLEDFSKWEEIVELTPDKVAVNEIIDIFSKEINREPFKNDSERKTFINKFFPNKKNNNGANLRLLKIYLETWQSNRTINYISEVSEEDIIVEFRKLYLSRRTTEEIDALWFISSLYQFDAPLQEDFVLSIGNLVDAGLIRLEENRYHLPHSVDAYFLYKAICNLKRKNYVVKMKFFAHNFVNKILENECPGDFQSDFRLLISGLIERRSDFKEVIYDLTNEDLAKEIMTKINPGFILTFFNIENHKNPDKTTLINYYHSNKNWLIPLIRELPYFALAILYKLFKKNFGYDIFKDIFENTKEFENYLQIKNNYKALAENSLLSPILVMSDEYKIVILGQYKKYKSLVKDYLLSLSQINLYFIAKSYKKHFNYNIFYDIFVNAEELEDYLTDKNNYKGLVIRYFITSIAKLGVHFKTILLKNYVINKALLKPLIYKLSVANFIFLYKAYKKHLDYNIFKDVFENATELDDYLSDGYKALVHHVFIRQVSQLNPNYKSILLEHYKKNKVLLKSLIHGLSPLSLSFLYNVYKKTLDYEIVKDIFDDVHDLDAYLRKNEFKKFQTVSVLKAINELSDQHKLVLNKYKAFNYFFYTKKISNNSICINPKLIFSYWNKKQDFDISIFNNKGLYFYGVSWHNLVRFVYIIKYNINDENRQQSINVVKNIIKMVLEIKDSLSSATATNLSYFYLNIVFIDEKLFSQLAENELVRKDVENRLHADSYTVEDLYLFAHFFSQTWCKALLVSRILNADEAQLEIIKKWHDKVLQNLYNKKEEITTGSLLDFIHNNSL